MDNTTAALANFLALPQRRALLLLGIAIVAAAGLLVAERVTLAMEQARVSEALAALARHPRLKPLEPASIRPLPDGTRVALFDLERPGRGYDMLVLEVDSRCGATELAAATPAGELLQSVRDQRYLASEQTGSQLFVLTIYRTHVETDRYVAALRFRPECVSAGKLGRLAAHDRAIWAGPPLADVFRRDAGTWRANLGMGSQWVERGPDARWIKQALAGR
jgi:hypothetical protein